jgi:hypothetical protein
MGAVCPWKEPNFSWETCGNMFGTFKNHHIVRISEFPVNLAAQLNKPYLHIKFRIVDPDRFGQVLGCNRILG